MKIIEVRDGFIKFEADEDIFPSSFVKIDECNKSYIAQVNRMKSFGNINLASAKILFLYDGVNLLNYDNTEPSRDSLLTSFNYDILNTITTKKPVIVGKTLDNKENIKIDASAFNKKMLVCIDNENTNNVLVRNFSKQFENLGINTVVLDTLGVIKAKKYRAGIDFKLPLNTSSLAFMYEACLNDATQESKAAIIEIFKALSDYSETVPFVPFAALKTIVDDMVDNQHVFNLLVLKNKLAKYEKLGYFASTKKEVENLQNILNQKCSIIDLSSLDTLFQNRYLAFIYEKLESVKNVQVLIETSNTVSKKNLKYFIQEANTPVTIITHSKFKYLNDFKSLFDNFIIEPTFTNNEIFKLYSTYLSSMSKNTYLTVGEATNYIPLISELLVINDFIAAEQIASTENSTENNEVEEKTENIELTEEDLEETDQTSQNVDNTEELEEENIEITDFDNDTESISAEEPAKSEKAEDFEEIINFKTISAEDAMEFIDKKSEAAIAAVAETITEPVNMNLFEEEGSEAADESSEYTEESHKSKEESLPESADTSEESPEAFEQNISEKDLITPEEDFSNTAQEKVEEFVGQNIEKTGDELIDEEDFNSGITEETPLIAEVTEEILEPSGEEQEIQEEPIQEELVNELTEETPKIIQETENISPEVIDTEENIITEAPVEVPLNEPSEEENSQNDNFTAETEETEAPGITEEETTVELDGNDRDLLEEAEIEQDMQEISIEELPDEMPNVIQEVDLSEPKIIPLTEEETNHDFDEIVELDASEAEESDIIVDITDERDTVLIDDNVEQQIMEDVDKVYTTMKEDSLEEISDSDLDLIDELNSDGEELEEYTGEELDELQDSSVQEELLEEAGQESIPEHRSQNDSGEILEKRDSNTPIVPVYDADIPQEDMVMSDPIQQGDTVTHAKYGNGVVEKMIKYGNKTLFAINFDDIGRRLLDPTLTEIKKA